MKTVENKVINENLAIEHLKKLYPSIKIQITEIFSQNNFAGVIQAIVNHIKTLLQEYKINLVNRSMRTMHWLYNNGNPTIKNVIENLFVRSFASFKKHVDKLQWVFLYQYMPKKFREIYVTQTICDKIMFKK